MGIALSAVPCANASRGYEIEYDDKVEEWYLSVDDRPVGTEEKNGPSSSCEQNPFCNSCCRNDEDTFEEVVIIHHEALRKVDFLLRYDELARCESPTIPTCVSAVKHQKLNRKFSSHANSAQRPNLPMLKNPNFAPPIAYAEDDYFCDDAESTCSWERCERDVKTVDPADLINHIVLERKKLQSFLQKMAVDGLGVETLENLGQPGKQRLLGRGTLISCVMRIEDRQDSLYLVLELHSLAPRIMPILTIIGIHFGSADEAIEGEESHLCMLVHQSVLKNVVVSKNSTLDDIGGTDVLHHVKFQNENDRDFFSQGVKRLRDHHRFHVSGRAAAV
eukprot:GEMP01038278.1.p1 GENE.GEMP01038278.1~~GEMP01038278.1.p1  ORF type:complete len:333 (+),score=80.31 GEMP01038278.1:75-1073(+)